MMAGSGSLTRSRVSGSTKKSSSSTPKVMAGSASLVIERRDRLTETDRAQDAAGGAPPRTIPGNPAEVMRYLRYRCWRWQMFMFQSACIGQQ